MEYLADTVAIVRHLRHHRALGRRAAQILTAADSGEHHIYISAITLMEVLYLAEAKRVEIGLPELIVRIQSSANYSSIPVDATVVIAATDIDDVPELHDRMLVATAKHLQVPILTGDRVISQSRHVTVIW